jgi:hypothetical protein
MKRHHRRSPVKPDVGSPKCQPSEDILREAAGFIARGEIWKHVA